MNFQDVGSNGSRLIEGAGIAGFEQHKTATAIRFVPTSQKRYALRRLSLPAQESIHGLSQGSGMPSRAGFRTRGPSSRGEVPVRDIKREGSSVFAGNGGILSVGVHQAEWRWLKRTTGRLKRCLWKSLKQRHLPGFGFFRRGEIGVLPGHRTAPQEIVPKNCNKVPKDCNSEIESWQPVIN